MKRTADPVNGRLRFKFGSPRGKPDSMKTVGFWLFYLLWLRRYSSSVAKASFVMQFFLVGLQ